MHIFPYIIILFCIVCIYIYSYVLNISKEDPFYGMLK